MASPERLGAVERSPHYAPSLNAEPLACHTDDHQLSAGYREVEPAREKLKGSPVSDIALEYSMRVGIILVISLMIFAFANDIARLI